MPVTTWTPRSKAPLLVVTPETTFEFSVSKPSPLAVMTSVRMSEPSVVVAVPTKIAGEPPERLGSVLPLGGALVGWGSITTGGSETLDEPAGA